MARVHYAAIIFAIAIGIIMVAPQLYFMQSAGDAYRGIIMPGRATESHSLAQVEEFADTGRFGNPYFAEEQDLPVSSLSLVAPLLALPTILFGIPVASMDLWYKGIFPMIAFLLLYSLGYRLTRERLLSLAASSLVILGSCLFTWSGLYAFASLNMAAVQNFLPYAEPIDVAVSGIIFFVFLHVLLSLWKGAEGLRKLMLFGCLAVIFALSFYVSFYLWSFFAVLSGIMVIAFLYSARPRDAVHVVFAVMLSTLASIPYLLDIIHFMMHPYYIDVSKTFDLVYTHMPHLYVPWLVIAIIFGALLWFRKRFDREAQFLMVLLIAAFLLDNQQLLSGRVFGGDPYLSNFTIPIIALAALWMISIAKEKIGRRTMIMIASFVIFVSFGSGITVQAESYHAAKDTALSQQSYAPIFGWLNQNAKVGDVVLADGPISELIPAYTKQNVYWSDFSFDYLVPRIRFMEMLFMYSRLYGIPPDSMPEENFETPIKKGNPALLHVETSDLLGDGKKSWGDFYPDSMATLYQWFYDGNMTIRLHDYRIDYIVIDRSKESGWLAALPKMSEVYRSGDLSIFQVPPIPS
jgi:hypothetical protein